VQKTFLRGVTGAIKVEKGFLGGLSIGGKGCFGEARSGYNQQTFLKTAIRFLTSRNLIFDQKTKGE